LEYPLSVLGSVRRFLEEYVPLAEQYSQIEEPVTVIGENGTGKTHLARLIHAQSSHCAEPFIHVICEAVPENGFQVAAFLLKDSLSSQAAPTLFFENLDSLNEEMQRAFLSFLNIFPSGSFRMIVSLTRDPETSCGFNRKIIETLGPCRIYIKSLNHCPDLIPEIAGLFISKANQKLGKQIIAIDEEGIRLLQKHHWTDNLSQLDRTIQTLCLTAAGPVISAEETRTVLQDLSGESEIISLDGSLEEITLRIIRDVLRQEGGSITRTAGRLGISRSTLWRKLGNAAKPEKH